MRRSRAAWSEVRSSPSQFAWVIDQRYRFAVILLRLMLVSLGMSVALASCSHGTEGATAEVSCEALTRNPVLFVHGSGLSSASWAEMIDYLASHGYPIEYLFAVDMFPDNGDNIRAAEIFIAQGVERLLVAKRRLLTEHACDATPEQKIDIVSHSMGAVSSRWYARFVSPERVGWLITLAGANHGTNDLCGHRGEGNRQMCPAYSESTDSVQYRLNGSDRAPVDETPHGAGVDRRGVNSISPDEQRRVAYLTVRLAHDEWIDPAESAMLDGADDFSRWLDGDYPVTQSHPGNLLFDAPTGHDDLPMHPELIRLVTDVLSAPD